MENDKWSIFSKIFYCLIFGVSSIVFCLLFDGSYQGLIVSSIIAGLIFVVSLRSFSSMEDSYYHDEVFHKTVNFSLYAILILILIAVIIIISQRLWDLSEHIIKHFEIIT